MGLTTLKALLIEKNPEYVIVTEPNEFLRKKALELGATEAVPSRRSKIKKAIKNLGDPTFIFDTVGIKETLSDVCIDVISVGCARAVDAIKRSIGMGADNGVHIEHEDEEHLSPALIGSWIAQYAKHHEYKLILTGAMSEDCMNGQTGPMIAAHLRLPCATGIVCEKVASDEKSIYVEREIEGGKRDTLELDLPAVLTIRSGNHIPRYPVLSKLLRPINKNWKLSNRTRCRNPKPGKISSGWIIRKNQGPEPFWKAASRIKRRRS